MNLPQRSPVAARRAASASTVCHTADSVGWQHRCTRYLQAACLTALVLLALAPCASGAELVGTYVVDTTGTAGAPASWHLVGTGGHYRAPTNMISTGAGTYAAWDDLHWRLELPGNVRTVSGSVRVESATPSAPFAALVRVGGGVSGPRTVATHLGSGTFTDALLAGADWIDVGLVAQSATTLSISGSNYVSIGALHLVLADAVVPNATLEIPDAAEWHGPSVCINASATGTDADSGVVDLAIDDESIGATLATWNQRGTGLRPGSTLFQRQACLPTSGMTHGINVLHLVATDAGGRSDDQRVQVRVDAAPPTLGTGPGSEPGGDPTPPLEAGHVQLDFAATDEGSGIAQATVTIDGGPVDSTLSGSTLHIAPAHGLAVGRHAIVIKLVDAVGNAVQDTRVVTIVDTTPPAIDISAPALRGGTTPWLQASASDEGSDIVAASWHVLVDGETVALAPVGASIAGPLGMLTVGSHVITLVVTDGAGNVTTVDRSYVADDSGTGGEAGATAIGARSGLFVVHAPRGAVVAGRSFDVSLLVATDGRPLAGYRVVLRGRGIDGDGITDARGVAIIRLSAAVPTDVQARVVGAAIAPLSFHLKVAALLRLRAVRRRAAVGAAIALEGSVSRGHPGERVQLEARVGASWYPLRRSVRISRRGTFQTTVTASVRGPIAVRVLLAGRGGWSTARSNVVKLLVR